MPAFIFDISLHEMPAFILDISLHKVIAEPFNAVQSKLVCLFTSIIMWCLFKIKLWTVQGHLNNNIWILLHLNTYLWNHTAFYIWSIDLNLFFVVSSFVTITLCAVRRKAFTGCLETKQRAYIRTNYYQVESKPQHPPTNTYLFKPRH